MSGRTRIALAAAVAALSLAVAVAPASAGKNGPNNANAKKCQSYLDWVRADGSAFQSSDECTAYAAKGGVLVAKPPPLSVGCDRLNTPGLDGTYYTAAIFGASFNAGEVITVVAGFFIPGATGVELGVGAFPSPPVVDSASVPGTLTYTVPSTGVIGEVVWTAVGSGAAVIWQVSCAAGS